MTFSFSIIEKRKTNRKNANKTNVYSQSHNDILNREPTKLNAERMREHCQKYAIQPE